MIGDSTLAFLSPWRARRFGMVGALVAVAFASAATAQTLPTEILDRFSQEPGFRTSNGEPARGLQTLGGFKDSMKAAISSPLKSATSATPTVSRSRSQALLERARAQRLVRQQQLSTQAARPRFRTPTHKVAHTLTVSPEEFRLVARADATPPIQTLQKRLEDVSSRVGFEGLKVGIASDGTAVVTGAVPSESKRRLVERMLMLEPYVDRVDNQLRVEPPAPTPLPSPKAVSAPAPIAPKPAPLKLPMP